MAGNVVDPLAGWAVCPRRGPGRASFRLFVAAGGLLFAAAAGQTIMRSTGTTMAGMPMPGGWTMSMAWMRMPGQHSVAAAGSFLGMWMPMMVAMMLPSLLPALWRYRLALGDEGGLRPVVLTLLVGIAYFLVWTLLGLVVFQSGTLVAGYVMRLPAVARAMPLATGLALALAGMLQLSHWKARRLACCRAANAGGQSSPAGAMSAWRDGLRLGLQCNGSCAGLTAAWLALGIMDWRAMLAVTGAITAERIAPGGAHIARAIGVLIIAAACLLGKGALG